MQHHQYNFKINSIEESERLVAMLSIIGFDGFEEFENELKAYTDLDVDQKEIDNIIKLIPVTYSKSVIKDRNWNELWEADFKPVTVLYPGSPEIFTNVRAHFHPPQPRAKYEVNITPKMSFGTGHHATTYGMIENMSKFDFANKTVIDFGTGTGILAILAEKLGAKKIFAIDNDEWSIDNAKENITVNNCKNIELIKAGSLDFSFRADIILANINLNVIVANLEILVNSCKPNGNILLSGMLISDEPLIKDALKKYPVSIIDLYERNNWMVIVATC